MEQTAYAGFTPAFRKSVILPSLSMGIECTWGDPQNSGLGAFFKTSLIGMLLPHTAEAANKSGGGGSNGQGAVTGALVIKM